MANLMPKTASVQRVQKQYRLLFDNVIETRQPMIILNKNNPEVVIVDVQSYQTMIDNNEKYEQLMAREAVRNYRKEKKAKKLKKLSSLADIVE